MNNIACKVIATSLISIFVSVGAVADTLIIGNKREHTVSFVDLASGAEVRRVETGRAPHEVAVSPDGKIAVVVSYREGGFTGNTLNVFDVLTGQKIRTISLGKNTAPHGLKWIGKTDRVAVTTEGSNCLVIVDVIGGKVVGEIPTKANGSHMVALGPNFEKAYVANIGSGSLSVIDLVAQKHLQTVKLGSGTEAISVSADGKLVWVGNNGSRTVLKIDRESLETQKTIPTSGIPIRVEAGPKGKYVAVSEADLHYVTILDAGTGSIVQRIDLSVVGGEVPVTLLWSPAGNRLWVATTRSNRIIEISAEDWSIVRAIKAGEGSDGLGYSPLSINSSED